MDILFQAQNLPVIIMDVKSVGVNSVLLGTSMILIFFFGLIYTYLAILQVTVINNCSTETILMVQSSRKDL